MSLSLRRVLVGIAFGILLALLIAPQTRWLVHPQISSSYLSSAERKDQFVRAHPNDYQVQLAGQPNLLKQTQVEYARSLVPRFPNNPSLRANILRYATTTLKLNRPEADGSLLSGNSPPQTFKPSPPTPAAEMAAFEADAEAGERLDSDNAYFPFMRSIGLFAAHKDAEGLAAIRRAGTKPAWREYYADEVEGHWRILDGADGHHEAVGGAAFQASVLFTQSAPMRAVARLVTEKAIREELAGKAEDGLTLRRSLAHIGDLMGTKGTAYITNLVGIAITHITWARPGGAAPLQALPGENNSSSNPNPLSQRRLNAYCTYVTRLGHPEVAQEARAQAAAGEDVRLLLAHQIASGTVFEKLNRLVVPLIAGSVLVAVVGLMALLGLAAWGLGRTPRVRDRQPLPAGATWGIWVALMLAATAAAMALRGGPDDLPWFQLILAVLLLVPLVGGSIYAALRSGFRRPFGYALLAAVTTLAALGAVFSLLFWQIGWAYGIDAVGLLMSDGNNDPPTLIGIPQIQRVVAALWAAALPLLLCMIFSLAARVRRVPVFAGVVQGFRLGAPLVLCLLAIGYGGLTLWMVRQENAMNTALMQSLHGEGQYAAQTMGQTWPGAVR